MKCHKCGTEVPYTDGFYQAEVIKPHGYIAPVHYYKCKNCGTKFKDNGYEFSRIWAKSLSLEELRIQIMRIESFLNSRNGVIKPVLDENNTYLQVFKEELMARKMFDKVC